MFAHGDHAVPRQSYYLATAFKQFPALPHYRQSPIKAARTLPRFQTNRRAGSNKPVAHPPVSVAIDIWIHARFRIEVGKGDARVIPIMRFKWVRKTRLMPLVMIG
jgi:hypothetical protein